MFGLGASSHVPKMSVREAWAVWRTAPRGPFTLSAGPSENWTVSKKHMYWLCRESDPVTRTLVPALNMSGLIPFLVSCVTPCDSHTYSRVLPVSSVAAI